MEPEKTNVFLQRMATLAQDGSVNRDAALKAVLGGGVNLLQSNTVLHPETLISMSGRMTMGVLMLQLKLKLPRKRRDRLQQQGRPRLQLMLQQPNKQQQQLLLLLRLRRIKKMLERRQQIWSGSKGKNKKSNGRQTRNEQQTNKPDRQLKQRWAT